ncbi:hypothetical protein CH063_02719 [Colletotrichum higginsianum]|uniref:Uncharacterized protein n=1 Tax=Colletotrichum higginsianum (strain IMI 349063) TaxID=759273 RepID=H1VNZ5_COLHI|nr:hypothetical protein CH63R_05141 [Colletotrichum higginsianum IMI 349063]OBR12845.1 hypothetical protein CH63R_05141 [Colletotrichum higginsianum IMI 349063]GJC94519.1 hypothetical protein ColKHC_03345 [Colletotrichum higginsianum]CCF41949.1 hypothetical protein CH063_02719 [Colletotrichum higginsianum]
MINDPREFLEHGRPADVPEPYLIFRPSRDTLEVLVQKVPNMTEQVTVAAIYDECGCSAVP